MATKQTITIAITGSTTIFEVSSILLMLGLGLSIRRTPSSIGYNAVVDSASNGHVGRGYGDTLAEAIVNAIEDWQK